MDLEVLPCGGECVAALLGGHVCLGAPESRCWGRSQQVLRGVRRPIWMLITFPACVTLIVPQVWGKCSWRVACQWKLPKSTECIKLGTLRQLASEREKDGEGWKPVMPPYHSQFRECYSECFWEVEGSWRVCRQSDYGITEAWNITPFLVIELKWWRKHVFCTSLQMKVIRMLLIFEPDDLKIFLVLKFCDFFWDSGPPQNSYSSCTILLNLNNHWQWLTWRSSG